MGFRVVDLLARTHGLLFERRAELTDLAWTAEAEIAGKPVILAKPRTFMNRSGDAAQELIRCLAAAPSEMLVVHDDADLDLGRVRLRPSGRSGGHNGLRSILRSVGTQEFPRLKLGVRGCGREGEDLAEYVLREFDPSERAVAAALVSLGADAVEAVVEEGILAAMNRFNACTASPGAADEDRAPGE